MDESNLSHCSFPPPRQYWISGGFTRPNKWHMQVWVYRDDTLAKPRGGRGAPTVAHLNAT